MRYSIFLVLLLAGAQSTAHAVDSFSVPGAWSLAEAQRSRLNLSEAADLVQKQSGGRILAAQAVREQGQEIYRIKLLTAKGEVRVVFVDAATGHME